MNQIPNWQIVELLKTLPSNKDRSFLILYDKQIGLLMDYYRYISYNSEENKYKITEKGEIFLKEHKKRNIKRLNRTEKNSTRLIFGTFIITLISLIIALFK